MPPQKLPYGRSGISEDSRQSSTQAQKQLHNRRREVLRQFSCPYMEEEPGCRHKAEPNKCVFGHVETTSATSTLRDVPYYACLFHLTNGKCVNSTPHDHGEGVQICRTGFHLSLDDMTSLERFESRNTSRIGHYYGEDYERDCGICLERVVSKRLLKNRKFALLINCAHVFCAECIRGWKDSQASGWEVSCPMCRVVSGVVFHATFVGDTEEKKKLLAENRAANRR